MAAAAESLSFRLFTFPDDLEDRLFLSNMNPPVKSDDWIYCLNSFRQYSPLQSYHFAGDRDFTLKSYQDAIINNIHCQKDIALNIVSPAHGLSLQSVSNHSESKGTPYEQGTEPDRRKYLKNLLIETQLLSDLIPKSRTVNYLHLSHPLPGLFGPAEMTELMYNLSKRFSLRHDGSGRYVIELTSVQCNDSYIALIKGLGFNHICLQPGTKLFSEEDCANIELIRDYEFESVHSRILLGDFSKAENQAQLSRVIAAQPDSICVLDKPSDNESQPAYNFPNLTWEHDLLVAGGYTQTCHRRYTRNGYDAIWTIHDLLTVGLGGTCFIDNIFAHNADQLDQYYDLLAQGKLPFLAGGYILKQK